MSRRQPIGQVHPQAIIPSTPGGLITPQFDYAEIVKAAVAAQQATQHIPALVAQEMQKSWHQLPNTPPQRSPKSWFFDPLSLQYSLGYKDRRYSITYDTLKRISQQLSIISGIINTRSAQVAQFSQPYRWTKSLGFAIRHKDPDHSTTPAEIAFIKELEQFILNCGRAEKNPYSRVERDDFETFLRKIVRDTLTFDQTCFEIIPDRLGLPFEFYAIDASTIRFASDDRYVGVNASYTQREGFVPSVPARFTGLYEGREYGTRTADGQRVQYVQIINGQIENIFGRGDLAFGVRNPRTDIYIQGYGYGELEQLITIVTAHLNAEEYNRKFFCMCAESLVNTKNGMVPVADLVDQEFDVWTGTDWQKAKGYATGPKPVHRTKLWNGLELRTSSEHLFRVIPRESTDGEVEWRKQCALKEGDHVLVGYQRTDCPIDYAALLVDKHYATDRSTGNSWTPKKSVVDDVEFWEMVGFALGDGYWPSLKKRTDHCFKIFPHHTKDAALFDRFLAVCERHGINAARKQINKHHTRVTDGEQGYPAIMIQHKAFVQWLLDLGFAPSSEPRRMPRFLFAQPAWMREAVLRGLFSADGHRHLHTTGYATPTVHSADQNFQADVVSCLWSVGVAANLVGTGWSRKGEIDVQDVGAFVERIRYLQDYKNEETSRADSSKDRWDVLHPAYARNLAQRIKQTDKYKVLSKESRDLVCKVARGECGLSRAKAKNLASGIFPSASDEALQYCHVAVDVTDAEPIAVEQMYDIEVFDDRHLFLANHIAVHNTQGSSPKGILNMKGDNWTPEQLEAFRRHWMAQVSGVENCLSGDTRIYTRERGFSSIADVCGEHAEVPVQLWTGTSWETGLVYRTKEPKVLCRTRLDNGVTLSTSPDHKVRVIGQSGDPEWRMQSELQVGDVALVNRGDTSADTRLMCFGQEVDEEFMEALGWLLGDGYIGPRNAQWFYHHEREQEILAAHLEVIQRFFPKAEKRVHERSDDEVERIRAAYGFKSVAPRTTEIALNDSTAAEWLRAHGFFAEKKQVPSQLYTMPAGHRAAYLRGLFSADGNNAKGRHPAVTISHDDVREQVKHLLLSLGIRCTLSEGKHKLVIRGAARGRVERPSVLRIKDRDRFFDIIGFLQPHKQPIGLKKLNESNKYDAVAPSTLKKYLSRVREQNADSGYTLLTRRERMDLNSILSGQDGCSRQRLIRYMHLVGHAVPLWLEQYATASVVSVENTGLLVPMFDVSVNHDDHMFVGDNVVVSNSWKTPILQSEGIEWVDLNKSNAEMEFGKWMEYLIKISCGVYLIDPAELNFDLHGGVQQTPLFESSQEWKLKASRDRGLKPLLRFIAKMINKHIIDQIDDHFTLEFVGLDEMSEQEKHEMLTEQLASYMTLNEVRRSLDLPELPGGDVPMNPVYFTALEAQGMTANAEGAAGAGADPNAQAPTQQTTPGEPQYTEHFGANPLPEGGQ